MKKRFKAWLALGLITLVAGLMLSMTNEVTKDRIEQQKIDAQVQARKDVLPAAETFEAIQMENLAPLTELYAGKAGDEVVGYVGMASPTGYGGPVQVIAGVDAQGRVTGVAVGGSGTGFAETAGLGAKAQDPAFMNQFSGKQTPLRAVKSAADRGDNTIDAITAATITSNTVTGAVNNIASKVNAYLNPDDGAPAEGTTYTASAQGFAGPVAVFVTVKDDGAITGLQIGDEKFNETENYGAGAKESGFIKQFVGKTLPLTIEDIDAISGATITTKAVVEALNKAIEDKVVVAPAAPEGTRYTASEKGFAGPVAVFVTVKDDGTVTALEIGDEQFKETENYGAGAKESGFKKQFVGKTLPVAIEDIDAISGATITTKAVIAAINRAYEEKLVDGTATQQAETPEAAEEAQTPAAPEGARTETSSSKGYGGPVAVTIWLNDDDTIAAMTIGDADFSETQGFGSRAQEPEFINSFIGKKVPLAEGDVDVLAGATVTSEAVIKAVNKAAEKLGIAAEAAAPEASAEPVQEPAAQTDGKTATSSSKGYAGPVAVTITLNDDNTIAALSVGDADFAETDGLGSRTKDAEFTDRFIGKKVPLVEGDVDVLAGATVTSEAVIKAVNKAAEKLGIAAEAAAPEASAEPVQESAAPSDGKTATSSSKGYAGPVAVTITLNDDNTIAALSVGDADFAETDGLGSRTKDTEFTDRFIGKSVPLAEGDVDVLAGATVTSEAVIKAVNKAAEKLGITAEAAAPEASAEPVQEPAAQTDGKTATSSSKGYAGPVAVTITLNDDDTIAALTVGDADFAETDGLGSRTKDAEFTDRFIGKSVPLAEGDVDVLAGATVTSEAVIKAVNKAAEKLGITAEAAAPAARTATSSSKGYAGPVAVTITLNDDNTIAALTVGDADFAETDGLGSRTKDAEFTDRFIGKKVPLADGDVDVLAGATVTSEAVIKAVNKAAEVLGITAKETVDESSAPAGEAKASAQGYKSPIAATLTLNADYTIKTLVIGDENFNETVHIGAKVLDKEFAEQFIGKKVPLKEGDADTITNATVSSLAVIEAINLAAAQLMK